MAGTRAKKIRCAAVKPAGRGRPKAGDVDKKVRRRFCAIDFETADHGRDSACAVSLVVVDGNDIAERRMALIRPPRKEIVFSYLHGITWAHVRAKPVFGEVWQELAPLVDGVEFVAAHNAKFDKAVLDTCCAEAGIKPPGTPFLCTVELARTVWGIFPTKLPDVCRKLRIPLNHHDAASDALACAGIVMAAMKDGFDPATMVAGKKMGKGRAS